MAEYPRPSTPGRSANMRAIRRTDTKPEIVLRRALHRLGYRYRKDYRLDLAAGRRVRPDIAFTARRVAVFVDGCFWHACPQHGRNPAVNDWYWAPKLRRTVERDRAADDSLAASGWQVVRIWEHESLEAALAAVIAAVGPRDQATDPAGPGDPSETAGPGGPSETAGLRDQATDPAGPGGPSETAGLGDQATDPAGPGGPSETAGPGDPPRDRRPR